MTEGLFAFCVSDSPKHAPESVEVNGGCWAGYIQLRQGTLAPSHPGQPSCCQLFLRPQLRAKFTQQRGSSVLSVSPRKPAQSSANHARSPCLLLKQAACPVQGLDSWYEYVPSSSRTPCSGTGLFLHCFPPSSLRVTFGEGPRFSFGCVLFFLVCGVVATRLMTRAPLVQEISKSLPRLFQQILRLRPFVVVRLGAQQRNA